MAALLSAVSLVRGCGDRTRYMSAMVSSTARAFGKRFGDGDFVVLVGRTQHHDIDVMASSGDGKRQTLIALK